MKAHLKPLHRMVVHLQSNGEGGGALRNELDDEVMWRHLTNSHVIEENL